LAQLEALQASLAPARTLDAACGTGYLTRHLRGLVVGIDRSRTMAAKAAERIVSGLATVGDALDLPFSDSSFDRVVAAHFYGHLSLLERSAFLAEAERVSPELLVVDSALRPGVQAEQWQERVLNDGSRHRVYKRYLEPDQLAGEIAGQVVLAGTWFVAARARRHDN
jgi:ubiquinone/menaquinone biosynthesis C-methylase UbiE